MTFGDFYVVAGETVYGGPMWEITGPPPPPPGGDCECDGKVTWLTLQYNGSATAEIKVKQGKKEIFKQTLNPGDQFTVNGADKEGTLGKEIKIYVDGDENAKIHTSCSQPIYIGLVKGDFEIIDGESRYGGTLCPGP